MAIEYHKLNMFIPIVVTESDAVFLVDWLLVLKMFYLYLIKKIRNTFFPLLLGSLVYLYNLTSDLNHLSESVLHNLLFKYINYFTNWFTTLIN